jgi:hypothetical protein
VERKFPPMKSPVNAFCSTTAHLQMFWEIRSLSKLTYQEVTRVTRVEVLAEIQQAFF